MGKFKGSGGKWRLFSRKKNYWQQAISKRERMKCIVMAVGVMGITGWLFYRTIWAFLIVWPLGIWVYKILIMDKEEKLKGKFLIQFKDMAECMAQALNVGYSAENAVKEALEEIKVMYSEDAMIRIELEYIVRKLRLQMPMEQLLDEFAEKVELEDIRNFVTVYSSAKRSGGDMIAIIRNAVSQISEKIDVKREIDILLAAKKYEFRIMCVIPYAMIFYMQISFPEFMNVLYGNVLGIGVMTVCLGIYIAACILGSKIIEIDV